MVAVGLVRSALAAQRRHRGRQGHLASGADGEALECAPLVGGLCRALVLAVEDEAHGLAALVGGHGVGELELAVVDDAEDAAHAAVVLEDDVAGPGGGGFLEEHAHPPSRRRLAAFLALGGPPALSDLLQAGGPFDQTSRHPPGAAELHEGRAQPAIALVALGDQAAPVRVDRADAPHPLVHGRVADEGIPSRVRLPVRPAATEPVHSGPPHEPSPAVLPSEGVFPPEGVFPLPPASPRGSAVPAGRGL